MLTSKKTLFNVLLKLKLDVLDREEGAISGEEQGGSGGQRHGCLWHYNDVVSARGGGVVSGFWGGGDSGGMVKSNSSGSIVKTSIVK